jgi:3-oxoacyl-[acyl-carrier protein] reductase
MRLESRVAIITGAASGIGRATALRFAEEGAHVAVADIDVEAARKVVAEIEGAGGSAIAVQVDVARPESTDAAIAAVVEAFGKLDILINNAGINRDASAAKITEEQWDSVLDVNLKGSFFMSRAAMAAMIPNKYGRIVSTASIAVRGNFGQANYAASKAGIIGLTRTLALEAARHGINVNCISPGPTRTPMAEAVPAAIKEAIIAKLPLKRLAEPSEIAAMHLFLASEEASFVTGQHIFCDGGASVGT